MNKRLFGMVLIPVVLAVFVVGYSAVYILPEGKQVIVTQFGRPIGKPITDAGLHFKKPFVQDLRFIEKRILRWDGYPNQVPTKDKKYIYVDTTARWRVSDALKFIQTVQNERGAQARLDGVLDAVTRDVIANHNLVEAVRNTNQILESTAKSKDEEEDVTGQIVPVHVGREQLSRLIIEKAEVELEKFGIDLIDVQLRRISYEESVQKKVYDRMISERKRAAQKIRSYGKGEQAKIKGKTNRDLLRIQSAAYRKAQNIKGRAESESITIYAKSLSKDPSFYEFIRTLDAYKKAIPAGTRVILSTDSKFLNLLRKGN